MGHQADFYLAAGAVLPILVFGYTVEKRIVLRVPTQEIVDRIAHVAPRIQAVGAVWWSLFYGWAEWVCLRSLQTGRAATGGSTVVWIALVAVWGADRRDVGSCDAFKG